MSQQVDIRRLSLYELQQISHQFYHESISAQPLLYSIVLLLNSKRSQDPALRNHLRFIFDIDEDELPIDIQRTLRPAIISSEQDHSANGEGDNKPPSWSRYENQPGGGES